MDQNLDNIQGKTLVKGIILIVVGALLFIGGYFIGEGTGFDRGWDNGFSQGKEEGEAIQRAACSLGASASVANPLDNMPSANPFEDSVNPFK